MKNSALILSAVLLLIAGILFGMSYSNYRHQDIPIVDIKQAVVHSKSFVSKELSKIEESTIELFDKNVQSVAFITTSTLEQNYWNRNITEIPRGSGSGFVWDQNGHIVTNFHVIKGADKAMITMHNQKSYIAKLIGVAPDKDLAVLKIDAPKSELVAISQGNSDILRVGQSVFAIGNPFGLDYTLTTGIISALGREINSTSDIKIKDAIQTDAAINPGNSGGPLLNSSGELIGVNTSIISPSGAYAGIGFSIPVDLVKWVFADLIKYGKVKRPVLGVELLQGNMAKERFGLEGALIMNVIKGKGAEKAGLQGTKRDRDGRLLFGDLIIGINKETVINNSDLVLALEKFNGDKEVEVKLIRNGQKKQLVVQLGY